VARGKCDGSENIVDEEEMLNMMIYELVFVGHD
jgi:hypothetical protein